MSQKGWKGDRIRNWEGRTGIGVGWDRIWEGWHGMRWARREVGWDGPGTVETGRGVGG